MEIPLEVLFDESDPMNKPLSKTLNSCKVKTSPELDGIHYKIIRGFSSCALDFIYLLFIKMFLTSLFSGVSRSAH